MEELNFLYVWIVGIVVSFILARVANKRTNYDDIKFVNIIILSSLSWFGVLLVLLSLLDDYLMDRDC